MIERAIMNILIKLRKMKAFTQMNMLATLKVMFPLVQLSLDC